MTALPPGRSADEIRQRVIYDRRERPLVEVRVGNRWLRGRLCYWFEDQDGAWSLRVTYRSPGDSTTTLGRFAAVNVRSPAGHNPRAA